MDHVVGELTKALEKHGFADDTLLVFSSDNGPEVPTVINMRKTHKHDGSRPWRGVKRDNWEGGHRVPMLVRWPGQVKAGSVSDQTVCLTDLMATCAKIVGAKLPDDAAEALGRPGLERADGRLEAVEVCVCDVEVWGHSDRTRWRLAHRDALSGERRDEAVGVWDVDSAEEPLTVDCAELREDGAQALSCRADIEAADGALL